MIRFILILGKNWGSLLLMILFMLFTMSPLLVSDSMKSLTYLTGHKNSLSEYRLIATKSLSVFPISFEANHGQTDERVDYISRGAGYSLFLTPSEAVFALNQAAREDGTPESSVIRMKMSNANSHARVVGQDQLPGVVNYFIGNDPDQWVTDIPTFAKVRYRDVYPGVDLVYYGNQGQLEYDFVVEPGVDPNMIALDFEGVDDTVIDDSGDLLLANSSGMIRVIKPYIYQEIDGTHQEIAGAFVLGKENQVGFEVGDYIASKQLVIDPLVQYSTYLGGTDFEEPFHIAVDDAGSAYLTGYTLSPDFPKTSNPYRSSLSGPEVFVTKLSPDGASLVYSTFLGGSSTDIGKSIAIDGEGNAYITGLTFSQDFPTTLAAWQPNHAGLIDAFVTKLNASGNGLVYSTFIGGTMEDETRDIALDDQGNAYVVGTTKSDSDFPVTTNSFQAMYGGGSIDAFVLKLDPTGSSPVFSTYLGGEGSEQGFFTGSVDVDANENVYIAIDTDSTDLQTVNAYQSQNAGGVDIYIAKFDPSGSSLIYGTYLGGSDFDGQPSIAVDTEGHAYLTGLISSRDFPTQNAAQNAYGGGDHDGFVTKLAPQGNALVFSSYWGGSDIENLDGSDITVDDEGVAYLIGYTHSQDFTTVNPIQSNLQGVTDATFMIFDATGQSVFSTYFGGSIDESGAGIALDTNGNIYGIGWTESFDLNTTPGSFSQVYRGSKDAFVVKILP